MNSVNNDIIQSIPFDVDKIRAQFPILNIQVNNKPLVYLDNGASTQKPNSVIETTNFYYSNQYSNIHRGVHKLSQIGTDLYEKTRLNFQHFINATTPSEIIFTKGTTHGINTIAYTYGRKYLQKGDEILISGMEHHSNIVPWQIVCEIYGAILKVVPIEQNGTISLEKFKTLLSPKTKLVAMTYISNSLGTINPIKEIIDLSHQNGSHILVDAAQAIHHLPIDVQELDCDFLVFSAHKMYGPTGTGILYGKEALLDALPPFEGGGDMIKEVRFDKTTFNDLPFKFEAGTPNIAGIIGLNAALDFIKEIGLPQIMAHDKQLLDYCHQQLGEIDGIRFFGTSQEKAGVVSFLINEIHPYDIGVILDNLGIAIRTGHHCTQPVMDFYNIPGTCRASFGIYNTMEEIDVLTNGLKRAVKMLS